MRGTVPLYGPGTIEFLNGMVSNPYGVRQLILFVTIRCSFGFATILGLLLEDRIKLSFSWQHGDLE